MYKSIQEVIDANNAYDKVYDETSRIIKLLGFKDFYILDFGISIKEKYTKAIIDDGYDRTTIEFSSKYYVMEDKDIKAHWNKLKEEERKQREEEIKKAEEEREKREKESRYKEYLKLKEEFEG